MKKKYINILILLVCAIGVVSIYLYDVFCLGTAYTKQLPKVLCVLCSFVLLFIRSKKRLIKWSFPTYEKTYADIIGNAFCYNLNLKEKLLIGIYDYNKGKYKRAIKRLSKLCKKAQEKSDFVSCMFFIALSYDDLGCAQEAIEMYKKVLEIAPQNATASNNIARLYLLEGDVDTALYYCEKAIESNPFFLQAYLNRAQLYLKNYMPDKVIPDAEKALDIKKDSKDAIILLLVAYKLESDDENAEKYYNKALDMGYDMERLDSIIEFYEEMYE